MYEEQMQALQKQVYGNPMLTLTTDVAIVLDTFDRAYGKENRDQKYGGYPGFIIYACTASRSRDLPVSAQGSVSLSPTTSKITDQGDRG